MKDFINVMRWFVRSSKTLNYIWNFIFFFRVFYLTAYIPKNYPIRDRNLSLLGSKASVLTLRLYTKILNWNPTSPNQNHAIRRQRVQSIPPSSSCGFTQPWEHFESLVFDSWISSSTQLPWPCSPHSDTWSMRGTWWKFKRRIESRKRWLKSGNRKKGEMKPKLSICARTVCFNFINKATIKS